MAITKREEVDKIEIVGQFKIIQQRIATVIEEDGKEISRTNHRVSFTPEDDISRESKEVQDLAKMYHTDAVKKAFKEFNVHPTVRDNEGL